MSDWTTKQFIFAVMMVTTGSCNTLFTKWADMMKAENSVGEEEEFNHPFLQADFMFIGEMMCGMLFYMLLCIAWRKNKSKGEPPKEVGKFPPLIFYIPAVCDMLATSLQYMGLTLTFASSYQMLRGSVIVFTGMFSVAFLGRKFRYYHWVGMALIIVGLACTGIADFLVTSDSYDINGLITGDLLILMGQIVHATQMVTEEKFVTKHNVPALLGVGWEGLFGFLSMSLLLIPMYYLPAGKDSFGRGNPRGVLEDALDGFAQLGNNPTLLAPISGNILSIAFFNFAGMSMTKERGATTRMVMDSVRCVVIWMVSLLAGWQPIEALQISVQAVGFTMITVGMFIYNDLLILPWMRRKGWVKDQVEDDLIPVDVNKELNEAGGNDNAALES
ncbi:unnamed protein product [Meganyctiphanes norvegica]|uniref:EamA domain-containing protein n=1 Tax=Meganyctiphanes norvegica TaxID=48144 RepID=A0AAV2QFC7_MEGNR